MQYTLKQVLDFAWEHKGRRCFKDMDYEVVASVILWASKNNFMLLVQDEKGLCGVSIHRTIDNQILQVDYLVAVRNGFKTFVKYYQDFFPGYTITAQRDGENVTINPRILCQQLRHL